MTLVRNIFSTVYRYYIKPVITQASDIPKRKSAIILVMDMRNPRTLTSGDMRNPRTLTEVDMETITEILA